MDVIASAGSAKVKGEQHKAVDVNAGCEHNTKPARTGTSSPCHTDPPGGLLPCNVSYRIARLWMPSITAGQVRCSALSFSLPMSVKLLPEACSRQHQRPAAGRAQHACTSRRQLTFYDCNRKKQPSVKVTGASMQLVP